MVEFDVGGNPDLAGRLPLSLASLPLKVLRYADTDLCAPSEASFRQWLNTIPSHQGNGVQCELLSDRDILVALYDATGGSSWTNSQNWLTNAPLRDWYGVDTDSDDRVTRLRLPRNQLTGAIPPELGNLANLTQLVLRGNDLEGAIPPELGGLANLTQLDLGGNNLTGSIPAELRNLASLEVLYLYSNDIMGPVPPELGDLASLLSLHFGNNNLTGSIPAGLGDLANLHSLELGANNLTGSIPLELGNLASLRRLGLAYNELTGAIPPELGDLANLQWLDFDDNSLTGRLPPELGKLGALQTLNLRGNDLTDALPSELGDLATLRQLALYDNNLTGPIPPQLGRLANLETLDLSENGLSGQLPQEFGGLAGLVLLDVSWNSGLSGTLPTGLSGLGKLESLFAPGTDLCAPSDISFLQWLEGLVNQRVALCEGDSVMAYLVQSVQSGRFPVPLVAGQQALLRVFPTAARANNAPFPPVRASFYVGGELAHVAEIPGMSGPVPTSVEEGSLAGSANEVVPPEVVQPGLEMVVEIDPQETLDPALRVARRIPEVGRTAVDVRAMPIFDLTVIPFLGATSPDSSVLATTRDLTADSDLFWETRTLLPVGEFDLKVHEPVVTSSFECASMVRETEAIRIIEGAQGHQLGMYSPTWNPGGLALRGGRSSVAPVRAHTIAHELGHNFSLMHAPCGSASDTDRRYPYSQGSIGSWGYDFRDGGSVVAPSEPDLLSYCYPQWISGYHFKKALDYRLIDERANAAPRASSKSLLLWGGLDADGALHLEPAFIVDATPTLPGSSGDYRIAGWTAEGRELFSLDFDVQMVAEPDGGSSFVFALPVQPEWAGELASITLEGPEGSAMLDGESRRPMAILREPGGGQVRGFLRDVPPAAQAARDTAARSAETGLEVLFSRGIPDAAAWRR